MEAFVYTWTNLDTNQLYIGSHKGTPDDGYVCSSKPMLEDYMKNRAVFSRQIVATGTFEDMRAFEQTLLETVDARRDPQFYNQHNGTGEFYLKRHTDDSRRKISESKKGIKRPDLAEMNRARKGERRTLDIDRRGEKNSMFGKKHSEASIIKMSENRKGKGRQSKSPETKEKMRLAALKRWEKQRGD
jgi:hypothetical protein